MPTSATQNQSVRVLPDTSASRPRWNGFGYQLDTFVRILQAFLESLVGVTTFVAKRHFGQKRYDHREEYGALANPVLYEINSRDMGDAI